MLSVKKTGRSRSGPTRPAPAPRAHRFGSHLSVAGGLHLAVEEAVRLGFDTVQIFVKNQRQWRAPPLANEAIHAWNNAIESSRLGPAVAHASYLINLASPDGQLWHRSREAFADELRRCHALRIPYLVVHPGSAGDAPVEPALRRVARALNRILEDEPSLTTMPLLETTAGQGTSLGRRLEELAAIIDAVQEPRRVGVCIDSCHVFAAGYDIRTAGGFDGLLTALHATVGLGRVRCWHLNDSKRECGSRVDRHEHIGRGCIGRDGFRHILNEPAFAGLPMILETPKETDSRGREWDSVNLSVLARLCPAAHVNAWRRKSD